MKISRVRAGRFFQLMFDVIDLFVHTWFGWFFHRLIQLYLDMYLNTMHIPFSLHTLNSLERKEKKEEKKEFSATVWSIVCLSLSYLISHHVAHIQDDWHKCE